ncbi:MAG: RNase J family beta-CASP ribonuclease [Acidimicrobiia bacterium]|nr:RNase J family beta-CASP ribonuclease [Acidimicrobiia bacterium]
MSVSITFLGGLREIGRNCAALEINGRFALIDCGLMFPEEDMLGVDLVFPDWSWLLERAEDVDCVVLTHGHEDHVGALAYFLRDINVPVYGTRLTLELARGRIEELGIESPQLHPVDTYEWRKHGKFNFQFIPVSHSVPDATAIVFDTPEGVVVHSGDFKLDPTPIDGRPTDLRAFGELGKNGVRLLLSDSTNAENPGFVPSERSLFDPIERIIGNAEGRVFAACFSSHLHRVQQIANAGIASGRSVAFFGRSMHRNTEIGFDKGVLDIPPDKVVDIKELLELPEDQQLLITTGSQGEPFAALSLMSQGRHKFVDLEEGDTVLISATPIPGNETAVSKVISKLLRRGARVYHGRNSQVHVSGHAYRDELLTFLNVIRPQAMVPVHGEYRHLHAHAELARMMNVPEVDVLEDGDRVVIDGDVTRVERRAVSAGYVYLDGSSVGDVQTGVLRDRSHLADEGVVVVTVAVKHRSGEIAYGPDLDSHGVMDDPDVVLGKAADAVRAALADMTGNGFDPQEVQSSIRKAVAGVIRAETSRKPVIIPVVFDV